MGSYVLKCTKEDDYYVVWNETVEAPEFSGTRAETLDYLRMFSSVPPEPRVVRATLRGTSAQWPSLSDPIYGWSADGLIYEQRGVLPRAKLRVLCEALERGDEEAAWDLLKPFDDADEVRRG